VNLSTSVKISSAITPTAGAAGQTDINGSTLDMQGYEGVLMVVRMGAITAGAVTSIKAQQGSASDLSDAVDLAGTAQTIADNDDDKTFYIDLYRPQKRYVRLVVDRGTQDAVVASAHYIQYGARVLPTGHGTDVSGELHISPSEGTA
jgi:hypothetical protein